ncbi:MAG: NadS family protein [Sphingomonadaceae bacterium]
MEDALFRNLVVSIKQAVAIEQGSAKAARLTVVEKAPHIDAKAVRERTGLSQADFALVMNVSVKTLQNWEQRRRAPTGPAVTLLRIVERVPELALRALNDEC